MRTFTFQEIPENGADVAHLNAIHAPSMLGGSDIRNYNKTWLGFCKHRWEAKWTPCQEPDFKHIGIMNLLHEMILFNKLTIITMDVKASQVITIIFLLNLKFGNFLIVNYYKNISSFTIKKNKY